MNGDVGWKLTPSWIVLTDINDDPPTGHDVVRLGEIAAAEAAMFAFGGLHLLSQIDELQILDPARGAWILHGRRNGAAMVVHGTFDTSESRGTVERLQLRYESGAVEEWRFEEWDAEEKSDIAFARRIVVSDSQSTRVFALNKVSKLSDESRRAVRSHPTDFDATDRVRGSLETLRITDFRSDPPPVERLYHPATGVLERPTRQYLFDLAQSEFKNWCRALAIVTICTLFVIRRSRVNGQLQFRKELE